MKTMSYWRNWFLQSSNLPIDWASANELPARNTPACLFAGNDLIHTPATARMAVSFIPNSELHDDVVEKRADHDLLKEWDRKEWRDAEPRIAAIFAAFLKRADGK